MKDFSAVSKRLPKTRRSGGLDHEFLNIHVIVGMLATINDIHHGDWQRKLIFAVDLAQVCEKWHSCLGGGGFCCRQRDGQNGIRAQHRFVFCAVKVEHRLIQTRLVADFEAPKGLLNLSIDVHYCGLHAFTGIALWIFVSQFQRFSGTG